jgi:hypothetical protein
MEFRLLYDGPLKANGGLEDKQVLRRCFHAQLKELVQRKPMEPFRNLIAKNNVRVKIIPLGNFRFIPLITEKLDHVAGLHITFLSPEEPGGVITQGGDLDNRIKTLFDALRTPKSIAELPKNDSPQTEEDPFYCLLEDDYMVNGLSVTVDRLLRSNAKPSDVVLLIHVTPKPTYSTLTAFTLTTWG